MKKDDDIPRQEPAKEVDKALDQQALVDRLLATLRSFAGRVPLNFKFDREEANER